MIQVAFVLIVVSQGLAGWSGKVIMFQEFSSEERCKAAALEVAAYAKKAICVQK